MSIIEIIPLKTPVNAVMKAPGSKSYTNRALIMAALTKGTVVLNNPLYSEDTLAMVNCLKLLGIHMECLADKILVHEDFSAIKDKTYELFAKDSGTIARFLLPFLCIVPGVKRLYGNPRLNERPIKELVDALQFLGAEIDYCDKSGQLPLKIFSSFLSGNSEVLLDASMSSQFLSGILMIAPFLNGLKIRLKGNVISKPYVEMTLEMMREWGVEVGFSEAEGYDIPFGQTYQRKNYLIEGDFSSAGYFFALAALTESTITVKNLKESSKQADKQILEILAEMGNSVEFKDNEATVVGKQISPLDINMEACPDQVPTIAVLAAFADGITTISGVRSLRVKESDRILALKTGLKQMGIETKESYDTLTIYGGKPKSATIDPHGDHRIAMAFALAGMKFSGMKICNSHVVNKTFPAFWEILSSL